MMTLDTFVELSAILTGYKKDILKPPNNTQQLSELYFSVVNKEIDPSIVSQISEVFIGLNPANEANVGTTIVNDPNMGPIAKNIIRMWYLGVWYGLNGEESYVVSSIAYKNGLAWSTMSAHPMGYSEENFGYWNTKPAKTI